jgi:hypothetical protein
MPHPRPSGRKWRRFVGAWSLNDSNGRRIDPTACVEQVELLGNRHRRQRVWRIKEHQGARRTGVSPFRGGAKR